MANVDQGAFITCMNNTCKGLTYATVVSRCHLRFLPQNTVKDSRNFARLASSRESLTGGLKVHILFIYRKDQGNLLFSEGTFARAQAYVLSRKNQASGPPLANNAPASTSLIMVDNCVEAISDSFVRIITITP